MSKKAKRIIATAALLFWGSALMPATVANRAVQRSIHDAHVEDCTDAAEGDATPAI